MESEVVSDGSLNKQSGNLIFFPLIIITVLGMSFLYHKIAVTEAYVEGRISAWRDVNDILEKQHRIEHQQIRDEQKEAEQQLLELERTYNDVSLRIIEIKNGITVKDE